MRRRSSQILPPLALDDHHVVETDRLGEGDLQAGQQIAEDRFGGKAHRQTQHTRRGEQAGADLAHAGEHH